jgi:hypothetical protein
LVYSDSKLLVLSLVLMLTVSQFGVSASRSPTTMTDSGFVVAKGSGLFLKGKSMQLFGVNHADLIWSFIWPGSIAESGTHILEETVRYNITVVRYSAIGYTPDQLRTWMNDKNAFWSGYDHLITNARNLGIYLVPTLLWNPAQFSAVVGEQPSDVFQNGKASNSLFRSFVKELVSRYRNETIILMWEVGNELNLFVKPRTSYYSLDELRSFIKDTVILIKEVDPNHLIGSGMAAPAHDINPSFQDAVAEFGSVNDFVDVASVHTYPCDQNGHVYGTSYACDQNGYVYGTTETEYIRLFASAAEKLNKPLMIGEFGDNLETNPHSSFSLEVLSAAFSMKIPVALMWEWMVSPNQDPTTRLIWSVDPQKTPFMASLLQRFSIAAQTGASLGNSMTTKTETTTKVLTVQSRVTATMAEHGTETATVLSMFILGIALVVVVGYAIQLKRRVRAS